jgi:hypothetical protein
MKERRVKKNVLRIRCGRKKGDKKRRTICYELDMKRRKGKEEGREGQRCRK